MDPRAQQQQQGLRSYVDFEPHVEWEKKEGSDTLLVHLPEFKKEQLRVQVDGHRNLKVSGERPATGRNQWSRFRKDFRIPAECDANGIRAKFENGLLQVVLPKTVAVQETPAKVSEAAPVRERAEAERSKAGNSRPVTATPTEKPKVSNGKAQTAAEEPTYTMPRKELDGNDGSDKRKPLPSTEEEENEKKDRRGEEQDAPAGRKVPAGGQRLETFKQHLAYRVQRPNQPLLNIVVAALVLVGLGVYLYYNLKKPKDLHQVDAPNGSGMLHPLCDY